MFSKNFQQKQSKLKRIYHSHPDQHQAV